MQEESLVALNPEEYKHKLCPLSMIPADEHLPTQYFNFVQNETENEARLITESAYFSENRAGP